jgi:hypothetical protein
MKSPPLFDPLAVAIDWLDACQSQDLPGVINFYDERATLECACSGGILEGREEIAEYWRSRLASPAETGFMLEDLWPDGDGAGIDYIGYDGRPVRAFFRFTANGKIVRSRCAPWQLGASRTSFSPG